MSAKNVEMMREVMKSAWRAFRITGKTFSECLKNAWMCVKLRGAMKVRKSVEFFFKKVDGSLRQAFGTLVEGCVGHVEGGRKANPDIQVYWDNEKGAWRCFKKVNLVSVNF